MVSYIENAAELFGQKAKERLLRIFDAFGLPDAEEGAYLQGAEANLLFLNRYGLVLRTGYKMPVPEHDLILQPLSQTAPFGDHKMHIIEIFPGIESGVSGPESEILCAALNMEGIDFHDCLPQNGGHIPAKLPEFPNGIPVVLDRGAVSPLNSFFRDCRQYPCIGPCALRQVFNRAALEGFQQQFYRPLRESLRAAWPEKAPPDRKRLAGFLARCADEIGNMKQGKPALLSNRWMTTAAECNKPRSAVAAGARYDLQLQ